MEFISVIGRVSAAMSLPALAVTTTTQVPKPVEPPNSEQPAAFSDHNCCKYPDTDRRRRRLSLSRASTKPFDPTVSWTASIARRCRSGKLREAAAAFARMRAAEVDPNHVTFLTLLSGCADCADFGSEIMGFSASIHACVCKLGLDADNVMVGTALVSMYSKRGCPDHARLVFDRMRVRNSVSWNTMIDGYMRDGRIGDAVDLFTEMPHRDAVSWTAMIGGFLKKGEFEQAMEWFRRMQMSNVEPDYVTMLSVLAACANLGALGLGFWLNRLILHIGFQDNLRINNSLIDMYSRCGCVELACQVFNKMSARSVVSWNSIIVGFAMNGYAEEALEFFNRMEEEGFEPNGVTFTGALTACSHAGLVGKGLHFFDTMKRNHRITPRIEHYGCMVDLYSRAGRLEDAMQVIQSMPMRPNAVVLGSLLAACRACGEVSLAERLMGYLEESDPEMDSNYVLLSNTYAAVGRWDGASNVRNRMKSRGVQKTPGFSSIEVGSCVHEFVAGDRSHEETELVYKMLEHLSVELNMCGYVPVTDVCGSYQHD